MKEYIYSPHYDFYINKVRRTAGYDMKTFHLHKKYEIYYLADGTRKYFIEDSVYLVNAGNIVLIDKDEVHKTGSVDGSPHTRFVLNFNPEYVENVWGNGNGDLISFFKSGIRVLTVPIKVQGYVENVMQRMADLEGDASVEADILRKCLLTELLILLKKCVGEHLEKHMNSKRLTNGTIDGITDFIASNYREPLSLKEIAARFYISPYYLSHLFKKTTNLSVVEYINSVRIRAAKNYLETTELKITEVAALSGFGTSSHFSRVFKLGTGLSPVRYRKFYHRA